MYECPDAVLDATQIPGKRLSAFVSFGDEGNEYNEYDRHLCIECSFAWRVLHLFFKSHYRFEDWMRDNSPANRNELKLHLVLSTLEHYWRDNKKVEDSLLVFVGIDEYQRLGQDNLNSLLHVLCTNSSRNAHSKLTFFSMLAGTDLNMTRIVRTSRHAHKVSFILAEYPAFLITLL